MPVGGVLHFAKFHQFNKCKINNGNLFTQRNGEGVFGIWNHTILLMMRI